MTRCNRNLAVFNLKVMVKYLVKKSTAALLMALALAVIMPAGAVLADQSNPDSTPSATIYCFRNILESGDIGCYIDANIPYAATPDTTVNNAFIWRMLDTDGTTELGATTGSSYNANGYGYNVFWMYWAAADAPAWAGAYTVRLAGNPAIFDVPPIYDFPVTAGSYSALTVQADVQTAIETRIRTSAETFNLEWGLTPDYYLLTELETATVLSIYGENVFRSAIFGCQAIAPGVFRFSAETIAVSNRTFNPEYSDNVAVQHAGTWIDTAQTGGQEFFGTTYDLLSVILVAGICIGIVYLNTKLSNNVFSGLIDAAVILVFTAALGFYDMTFIALIAALYWVFVSMKFWGIVGR